MSHLPPLPLRVRAQLFHHLAAMEKAGVPAERAYALLDLGPAARSRVATFRRLFARGIDPATAGASSALFTLFETRLLRAAFGAGSPLATYQRLATSHATRDAQHAAIRARLVLPALILALALFVQPLPQLFTGTLSVAGYVARSAVPLALIACLGALAVRFKAWFSSGAPAPGRASIERLLLSLPLFGKLHLRANVRDFNESLAMLLQAGVALFEALPQALATVDNHRVRGDLARLLPAVKSGATLAQAIGTLRLVDTTELHAFVQTGEESGTLPEMLMRHADTQSEALALAQSALADWLPRVLYGLVAVWMAYQLLGNRAPIGVPDGVSLPSAATTLLVPQWKA